MRATFSLDQAKDVDATMTITMKVSEWKQLCGLLPQAWPAHQLDRAIRQLVSEAERTYTITHEAKV